MAGKISILGGDVVVVMNPAKVRELLTSPNEPVVRDLLVRAERVKTRAIREAPKKTGNLANHIVKRLASIGGQTVALVGIDTAQVPYALYVHEGAPEHQIFPRPGGRLVFFSEKAGKTIFMPIDTPVNHRGNKPNRFLVRALQAAV